MVGRSDQQERTRQMIKRVHRILSLAVAALWLVQALTGVLIVFHWEMEDALIAGKDRPLDVPALSRRIETLPKETGPDWALSSMWTSASGRDRFDISLDNSKTGASQTVRVAGDGTVLRIRTDDQQWSNGGWMGKLVLLHHNLLGGDLGSWIVGITGILLLSNILLGLKLAWPRAKTWVGSLWPGSVKATTARTYGWHRAIGLWIALPAFLSVSFGTMLVFSGGLGKLLGAEGVTVTAPASDASLSLSPRKAIETAMAAVPEASLIALSPPSDDEPWYNVRLLQPDELRRAYGSTRVAVDARTGVVLNIFHPTRAPPAWAFIDALFPVHTGEAGGLIGRILVLLTGLGLITMIVLGIRLWWFRRA